MSNKVKAELHGERAIKITRTFNASRELVFDAFTKPEMMKQWFHGPPGWKLSTCEVELRPGGKYRRVWSNDAGESMGMGGIFTEVERPVRAVRTERYDQPWYEGEAVGTFELYAVGKATLMTLIIEYESRAVRDQVMASPVMAGMETGYAGLDKYLETLL
ncbi:MAG: SRPBCC domain-containing protein [Bacteroidetes bacterium]|nr:SRPBCC domain-containing protein [Bacteroidota bacterium]MBS1939805.1 SRPBCC domain-containing protein [Bacteroidota bacterium]